MKNAFSEKWPEYGIIPIKNNEGFAQYFQSSINLLDTHLTDVSLAALDASLTKQYEEFHPTTEKAADSISWKSGICFLDYITLPSPASQEVMASLYQIAKSRISDFVETLKNTPELAGRMIQFLNSGGRFKISRRQFIEKYLMAIPEFRELLNLAEPQLAEAWMLVIGLIRRAITWLCNRFFRLLRTLFRSSRYYFSLNHFRCEQEKLWPLLMAFKNP